MLGVAAAIFIGIPVLLVVCLTAISAIGTSANDEFARVSAELSQIESQQMQSQGFESALPQANTSGSETEASEDFIYTSSNFDD